MKISFIRHAQGVHNLSEENWQIKFPSLTDKGINQCKELKNNINEEFDVILVSPVKRTLQTAGNVFNKDKDKFISLELIKEAVMNPCDLRESKEDALKNFPYVNFDLINDNYDYNKKETIEEVHIRCHLFYDYLLKLKYDKIAVVSHGAFLREFVTLYGKKLGMNTEDKWFSNCELRNGYMN